MKKQISALLVVAIGLVSLATSSCEEDANITMSQKAEPTADSSTKANDGKIGVWPINWEIVGNSNPEEIKVKFVEIGAGYKFRNNVEITVGKHGGQLVLQHQYTSAKDVIAGLGFNCVELTDSSKVMNMALAFGMIDENKQHIELPDRYHLVGSWYDVLSVDNTVTFTFKDRTDFTATCEDLRFHANLMNASAKFKIFPKD